MYIYIYTHLKYRYICLYIVILFIALIFSFVQSFYSYAIKKYNIIFNNKINYRIEKKNS